MSKSNDCWGIDVGTNAIKAVRLVKTGNDIAVADYAVLPFKKILTTPDLDVNEQIQLGLDELMSRYDLAKSTVVLGVPGHMAFARFAKLPPVDPKKIQDIVKFEAVQQIPFPIEQVEWDYQVFSQPDSPDMEVGIFAITKDKVADFLNNYEQVGINADALILSPLAVYNALHYDQQLTADSDGLVMVDIGSTSTDVIIFEAGNIWLRTLPIGGNNFTEAVAGAFKLSFAKAERLKQEARTSKYTRQIFTAMNPVFTEFVQELQRSLGYYQSLNREAKLDRFIGMGSTFRLPGMRKFLKQQLQMDVLRPEGFDRLSIDGKRAADFAEHTINFGTALGAALLGLDEAAVSANILPTQQVRQRLWRAKQPWFAASAAAIALPVILLWASVLKSGSDYESAVKGTDADIRDVLREAKEHKDAWEQISQSKDPRQRIENLSRVLDYRDVWPKIMHDLNMAAAALNPQAETLSSQTESIKKIPRAQRRRLYIDSIEANYNFVMPRATGGGDEARGMAYHEIAFGSPEEQEEQDANTNAGPLGMGLPMMATPMPPSFEITIHGTTPLPEAADLLTKHFIGWLREHSDQPDHPYVIEVPDEPLNLWPVPDSEEEDRPNVQPRTRRQPRSRRAPRMGRSLGLDHDDMMMGPGMGRRSGRRGGMGAGHPDMDMGLRRPGRGMGSRRPTMARRPTRTRRQNSLPEGPEDIGVVITTNPIDLLPLRPLAEELRKNDWEFEIKWTIKLVKPEDARKAETGKRIKAPEATGEQADQGEVESLL